MRYFDGGTPEPKVIGHTHIAYISLRTSLAALLSAGGAGVYSYFLARPYLVP